MGWGGGELESMGPSLDLNMRRTWLASDDLFKRGLKYPVEYPVEAKPNKISRDDLSNKLNRVHKTTQDLHKLQAKKFKG